MSWMDNYAHGIDLATNKDQKKILVVDSLGSHWRELTKQEEREIALLQASHIRNKDAEVKRKIVEKLIGHKPNYFIIDEFIPSKSSKDLSYPLVRRAVFIYLYNFELKKLEQK